MELHWLPTRSGALDGSLLEHGAALTEDTVEAAIAHIRWVVPTALFDPDDVRAVQDAILDHRLPDVTRVAHSDALAPYALYGIEATLEILGRVRLFIVDRGTKPFPVCRVITPWRSRFATRSTHSGHRDGAPFEVVGVARALPDGPTSAPTYRVAFRDGGQLDALAHEVLELSDDEDP